MVLTTDDLTASDTESAPSALTFTVENAMNGHIALDPLGPAVTSFTQEQLLRAMSSSCTTARRRG